MKKEKLFSEDLTSAERLQILKDNCEKSENFTYSKPLTPEELSVAKDTYSQNAIKLNALNSELDDVKKEFKEKMKPIEIEQSKTLEIIKHQAEVVNEEVFLMANHEAGDMEYYNSSGDMVYTRKLMPQERQTRMTVLKKASGQ